jgi:hypothetical protein
MLRQGIFLNEMKGFDELRRILFANVDRMGSREMTFLD